MTTTTPVWPPAPRTGSPVRSLFRAAAAIVYLIGGLGAASTVAELLLWLATSGPAGIVLTAPLVGGGIGAAARFGVPRPLWKSVCIAGFVLLLATVALFLLSSSGSWGVMS